jgi:hypothetical protein
MRRFPAEAQLQFLVGKEVGQIRLDPHSVQFIFWNGGMIHVDHDFVHVADDKKSYDCDCTAHTAPPLLLHRLIAKTITLFEVEPLRLTLAFNDGQKLILHSEEGPHECGQFWFSDDIADGYIVY